MGKTSFINRITKGYFMDNLSSTLGVDFQVKTFRVDERNIAIQLWDTAGQVRHIISYDAYFLLMSFCSSELNGKCIIIYCTFLQIKHKVFFLGTV